MFLQQIRLYVRILILMSAISMVSVGCSSSKQQHTLDTPHTEASHSDVIQGHDEPNTHSETSGLETKEHHNTHTSNSGTTSTSLDDSAFEDYGTFEDYADHCDLPIKDPLEPWNRIWFHFNDFFYLQITKPLYKGYEIITPAFFRQGMRNLLYNLQTPIRLVNSLLQGKIGQAWVELGKFLVNTTIGAGGLIEVTENDKPRIPVDSQTADFGHTLSTWGVGEGIYLIWPILGPSTVRDTFGTIGDAVVGPFSWLVKPIGIVPIAYGLTTEVFLMFNKVNTIIDAYESITKSAIEPYIALRDAYVKYRRFNNHSLCRVQP